MIFFVYGAVAHESKMIEIIFSERLKPKCSCLASPARVILRVRTWKSSSVGMRWRPWIDGCD